MEENFTQESISESRKYDFQSLSERITAQTEAYIGFSNALVKIIEQTANNRDLSTQIKELLDEEYRELNDGFRSILLEITKYHSDEVNNYNLLNKDVEFVKSKLSQIDTKIELTTKDNSNHQDSSAKKSAEIYNFAKEISDKIDELKKDNKTNNENIIKFVNNQDTNIKVIEETYKKIKYFIWSLGVLLTAYNILTNLHIINLTWFTNGTTPSK
jgi:glutamyl/glutaminyl-tRNA synthetase